MAVTVEPPDRDEGRAAAGGRGAASAVEAAGICPYLISADGAWRSARASREHRCGAISPAAVLTPEKQRSLCLVDAHETCATFRAAGIRAAGPDRGDRRKDRADALWPIPRTAPVVLESARPRLTTLPGLPSRTGGQILLGVLMIVAFIAVVLARTTQPGPAPTIPVATQAAAVTFDATIAPSATPTASVSPSPSSVESPAASATPGASLRTYEVRGGDTVRKIAAHFGISVKALTDANGITDPSLLRIGQVLKIPNP